MGFHSAFKGLMSFSYALPIYVLFWNLSLIIIIIMMIIIIKARFLLSTLWRRMVGFIA